MWSAVAFAAGWLVMLAALVSPVAWLSGILFSVHMTQHMLLMLAAAPLLTFGQPLLVWMWALREGPRERMASFVRRPPVQSTWRVFTSPTWVFLLQAAALWIWHVPMFYEAALRNDAVHAVQHLGLVVAAGLFWWAMLHGRYGRMGYGAGVCYVFLTAVHSSGLGAMLTVSDLIWYPEYARQAAAWGVDGLADQQLAGLLMWIPAGVIFTLVGLALLAAWLGEAERRVRFGATDSSARRLLIAVLVVGSLGASGCGRRAVHEAEAATGGDVTRGHAAIGARGCGTCHTIAGVAGAAATVGPPLDRIALRTYLGGHLTNTPANLIRWIQHPRSVDPATAMPDLGLTDQEARDIAAFLYTLR
jgi:cytochrome c oxidase assembly factor CtaG/cytochrome c2